MGTTATVYWDNISLSGSPLPDPPVADFTGTPTVGYIPLSIAFTDTTTNTPTEWYWDFGDTGSATAQNPTHIYTVVGTYTVTLTATNGGGTDWATKDDYVTASQCTASFSSSATSGKIYLPVTFTNNSLGTATGWLWDFGDTSTSTSTTPTYVYTTVGTYSPQLTFYNTATTVSASYTNYITTTSTAPTATFSTDCVIGATPLTSTFTDNSVPPDPITSWGWTFGDGSATVTTQNATHIYTSPGTYAVTLTATNLSGTGWATFNYIYVNPAERFISPATGKRFVVRFGSSATYAYGG